MGSYTQKRKVTPGLPSGFVLDQEVDNPLSPPEGFVLDNLKEEREWTGSVGSFPSQATWMEIQKEDKLTERAKILATTLNIPYSVAYDTQDVIGKEFDAQDSQWVQTAKNSFKRGMGNLYTTFGRALEWGGFSGNISEEAIKEGERMKYVYAPAMKTEEFTFDKILDHNWWATTPFESLPMTLSLIPAAIIAGYGGGVTATAVGLGTFGKVVLGSIGAGVVSRLIESALEAGGTYEEELSKGKSEEEARIRADYTFKGNIVPLTGVDIAQFVLAFTPLKSVGLSGTLSKRIAASAMKILGVGAMEAGEEAWQAAVQQVARGERPSWGPELKESAVVGAIFGLGLGGTGSVWTSINDKVMSTASKEMLNTFNETRDAKIALGATPEEAYISALDAMAETKEGKAHIEKVMGELKRVAEGEDIGVRPEVSEIEEGIKSEEEVEMVTDDDIQAISEEQIDAMDIADELGEIGEPKPEVEMFISKETYEKAKASLSEKLKPGTLRGGIDPTVISDMAVMGAYHIERGVRKFTEWSKVMIKEFGDEIKPHLRKLWKDANAYLQEKVPEKKVKGVVRGVTGQIKISDVIREDKALSEAMQMVQTNSRRAFKEGKTEALAQAKKDFEQVLLRARIKADIFGFKQGFKVGSRLTNTHLKMLFKEDTAAMLETRKEIVKYIDENLPADVRGKYLNAIIKHITPRGKERLFKRVEDQKARIEKKDVIAEIEELKRMRGNIAVDYQKKITSIVGNVDTKKITAKTISDLEGLKNYIEEQGIPSGIHTETIQGLKRLEMIQANDMTIENLKFLRDTAKQLTELGKVKDKLKYRYDERLRQEVSENLLASTENIDPEVSGEKSFMDSLKRGAVWLHQNTLQALRALDLMDGLRGYRGENAKLGKKLMLKEAETILKIKAIVDSAVTDIINIGMSDITPEQKVRIMINIRQAEGAYDQVNTLMKHYEYDDVPILTREEQGVIDIFEKYINQNVDEVAAVYEELTGKIFPKIDRYILPLKYAKESYSMSSDEITQVRNRTTHTPRGFTYERELNVKKLPDIELFDIFEQAINSQQWYIGMETELQNIKHLVMTEEYFEKGGQLNYQYWKDYLDVVSRRGWSANAHQNPFSSLLRHSRGNLTKAILGYKLSSILMQPFAIFDAMAYAQSKYGTGASLEIMKEVTHSFVNPKFADKIYNTSPMLETRSGGELAIEELFAKIGHSKSTWDKFVKGGLSLLLWADIKTATGVESGFKNILEKHGIPNAHEEAGFLMNLVSSSSEVTFRPLILSKGEGARALLTFQTFFLNRWGMIAHDLVHAGIIKGNWKAKYAAILGLGIMISAKIAEDETREFLYESITGKQIPDNTSIFKRILFAIPSNIPFFGNLFEFGKYKRGITEIPIARVAENIFRIGDVFTKEEWSKKVKGGLAGLEAGITVGLGIPGTAQFFDLLERILVPEEEGSQKPRVIKPRKVIPKRR